MSILKAKVEKIVGGLAILKFSDGQELGVSLSLLPKEISIGSSLPISFLTDEEATGRQNELARKILEELINGNEKKSR